ncbi:MAG: hypothetical protein KME64_39160 [Scytonematopsis contorta HA4267-MV1]|nr:hypothetical protein [Scytonematopsis contorta HA4267-MV1]
MVIALKGHQGSINSAKFSLDGKRIVTSSTDGTARVWNLSGKQLTILETSQPLSSPKVEADRLRDLEFYPPNCDVALEPWQKAQSVQYL